MQLQIKASEQASRRVLRLTYHICINTASYLCNSMVYLAFSILHKLNSLVMQIKNPIKDA